MATATTNVRTSGYYQWKRREADGPDESLYGLNFYVLPKIDKVLFNGTSTIVLWQDGTVTETKCELAAINDFDGRFNAAVAKKIFGTHDEKWETIREAGFIYT